MSKEKHKFAIYSENIYFDEKVIEHEILTQDYIYHRIVRVLRLKKGDDFIIFNKIFNLETVIILIDKEKLIFKIIKKNYNKPIFPEITILISCLKKVAFEEALYYCVEMGANYIQPVITKKSNYQDWNNKYLERLKSIIISAAEQSKNFVFPEIKDIINLDNLILENNIIKVYFDAYGEKLNNIINIINNKNINNKFYLMVGPEGDLIQEEKEFLKYNKFLFCSLTPTILRSQTAVAAALAIFRSIYRNSTL